jgi:transposase
MSERAKDLFDLQGRSFIATAGTGRGGDPGQQPPKPGPHYRQKYKLRNLVERLFNKLKNWRRTATRYDKTKESYLDFVALASVKLWIPFVHDA